MKTLHPKVFGGILARRDSGENKKELLEYQIPEIDLVIVDLYPFEETVASGADEQSVIEKIDIGGISLIRAAAKNYNDVVIISNKDQYEELKQILQNKKGKTTLEERRKFATEAFDISSHNPSLLHGGLHDIQLDIRGTYRGLYRPLATLRVELRVDSPHGRDDPRCASHIEVPGLVEHWSPVVSRYDISYVKGSTWVPHWSP